MPQYLSRTHHFRSPASPWMVFLIRSNMVVCHWSRREIESNSFTWRRETHDLQIKMRENSWWDDYDWYSTHLYSDSVMFVPQHEQIQSWMQCVFDKCININDIVASCHTFFSIISQDSQFLCRHKLFQQN